MIGYKSLDVYKRSYKLAKDIHQLTQGFPSVEKHELGSQKSRKTSGNGRQDRGNSLKRIPT